MGTPEPQIPTALAVAARGLFDGAFVDAVDRAVMILVNSDDHSSLDVFSRLWTAERRCITVAHAISAGGRRQANWGKALLSLVTAVGIARGLAIHPTTSGSYGTTPDSRGRWCCDRRILV